ncbi:ATP-binding protein [Streptomyces sp. NPDC059970]|uniref:ATP-binding protein n=1 Tax=Streptomyces sp. NPDC059970 TaxID=3347019 RepID=UPI003689F134
MIERGRQQIAWAVAEVEQGRVHVSYTPPPLPQRTRDLCADVVAALEHGQAEAWQTVIAAAAHQHRLLNEEAELAEIFRSIAPRLHSLINRTLVVITEAEREVEDPDRLSDLYRIDNLVTRMRRGAESLAVLGGDTPTRSVKPVLVVTALRMAVAEIEDYRRVHVVHSEQPVALPGYVSPSFVHLMAELMENATKFSSTDVEVRTSHVPDGMAVEVVDRGPGMTDLKRAALNELLAHPEGADPRGRLREGQIGLLVAALLARRYGIVIELHPHVMGGMRAVVILPGMLLVAPQTEQPAARPAAAPSPPPSAALSRSGIPTVSGGSARPVSRLPRRVPQTQNAANGGDAQHFGGRPDGGPAGGRPALPRRDDAPAGSAPAPDLNAPREPAGSPTPDLLARFRTRRQPADD